MKRYSLKNYKLIDNFDFDLNKINIIVGENSSGKSSVLRSIQLLKQSIDSNFQRLTFNSKKGLDFGNYYNLLPNEQNEEICFGIEFENMMQPYGDYLLKKVEWSYLDKKLNKISVIFPFFKEEEKNKITKIEINIKEIGNIIIKFFDENNEEIAQEITNGKIIYKPGNIFPNIIEKTKFSIENIGLNSISNGSSVFRFIDSENLKKVEFGKKTEDEKIINFLFNNNDIFLNRELKFVKLSSEKSSTEEMLHLLNEKYKAFKEVEIYFMINVFLNEINKRMKTMFNNISYTGAIRSLGERYYRIEDDIFKNDNVNNDVSKKIYTLYERGNLDAFNKFVSENLNFRIELDTISPKEEGEAIFYSINIINEHGNKKNLVDVGAGYSQILPILFACFGKEKNPETIIIIEQPELHLHPKMQSDLVDLFLKLSLKNPNLKLLIETHSDVIIDRIGKHIYKRNYKLEDLNLFIFNNENKLKISKTTYTEGGGIKEWPVRFFSAKEIEKWS